MDAATVYANKFGDCKALSNYLHAMLAACDIESFYTIIHTQNKHIPRDFATPAIANHAILGVPCQRDTLWLECTNTDVPFGYVHQSIAGHDAVICHDGKAEVVTLPPTPTRSTPNASASTSGSTRRAMPASRCRASVGRGNTSGHGRYWIWRATSKPTSCAGRSNCRWRRSIRCAARRCWTSRFPRCTSAPRSPRCAMPTRPARACSSP